MINAFINNGVANIAIQNASQCLMYSFFQICSIKLMLDDSIVKVICIRMNDINYDNRIKGHH